MFQIEQLSTSSCETIYEVRRGEELYLLRLWIIVGGTPALAFEDRKGPEKQYPDRKLWRGPYKNGYYSHQDTENPQGPTLDVLPEGAVTVAEFLEEAIPLRQEILDNEWKVQRDKARERKIGKPRQEWHKRVPENTPRIVHGTWLPDNVFATTGAAIVKALKGAEGRTAGAVKIGDVIVGVSGLRSYAKVHRQTRLCVTVREDSILFERPRGHSTVRYGAWDYYKGLNGYTCELQFGTEKEQK